MRGLHTPPLKTKAITTVLIAHDQQNVGSGHGISVLARSVFGFVARCFDHWAPTLEIRFQVAR